MSCSPPSTVLEARLCRQPVVETERTQIRPDHVRILLASDARNPPAVDVRAKRRDGLEVVDPRGRRLPEQRDEWVAGGDGLGTEANAIGQCASHGETHNCLVE